MEKIIEKLKALRGRLPIPKYESGYLLTDEEWNQIFTALEEDKRLREALEEAKILLDDADTTGDISESLRLMIQANKIVTKALQGEKGGEMRLTKLQQEFIDQNISKDSYTAFPMSVFKSKEYKLWKKNRKPANINQPKGIKQSKKKGE